jgi:tripartite-type tricarboxylate transporter receptor subunit TctC
LCRLPREGPTDIVTRIVCEQLSLIWGQQAVIENRGGAGTNIGNEMVARSDPDGYTVLFATASLAVNRNGRGWRSRIRGIIVARLVRAGQDAV